MLPKLKLIPFFVARKGAAKYESYVSAKQRHEQKTQDFTGLDGQNTPVAETQQDDVPLLKTEEQDQALHQSKERKHSSSWKHGPTLKHSSAKNPKTKQSQNQN